MKTLAVLFFFMMALTLKAQSTFKMVTYKNKSEPGLMLKLPYSPAVAQNTILQQLKKANYTPETQGALFWKTNKINGFYQFKGVQLPSLSNQKLDLYFKVDPRSQYEKNKSTLYLLVSKGYDNFVSPDVDSELFDAAKSFLNGFVEQTAAFKANTDYEAQKKVVDDAKKKMDDLKKKEEQLKSDLDQNQKDQQNLDKEISIQDSTLKALGDTLQKVNQ